MIKGNHSPAPAAMLEEVPKEVARGREVTPRGRKLTGDDVIVVTTTFLG